jgi:hypothetical protein
MAMYPARSLAGLPDLIAGSQDPREITHTSPHGTPRQALHLPWHQASHTFLHASGAAVLLCSCMPLPAAAYTSAASPSLSSPHAL